MTRTVPVNVAAALTLVLSSALPSIAHALALDDALSCGEHAHGYITSLQTRQLIPDHPLHVEDNAINVFWPARDAALTAFGFKVYAVIGYERDDPTFTRGSGEPMKGSLYGVVVRGGTVAVAKAVSDAGSPAESKHAGPFLTAIYCSAE
ncbi:hypothetical protein [Pararobbsia alpina]|uniref:Uncharacterized protein n=1 Tax=Pararobbsia alpina TaxID=621374 RepID=A0A6S7BJ28_9BURK|nr:hypothetical protein [Pararobbsia alpina]CAB3792896.1 hypothetical protein LMG28138_03445 [Pararobbsia alpina]